MKTILRYLSVNAQAIWPRQVEDQLKHLHLFSFVDVHGFCWHRQVEAQLKRLHSLTAITAADVVLEHQREAKPAFRVQVRLEVPGPGLHPKPTGDTRQAALLIHGPALHATARGDTLETALLKATHKLERQLQARQLGCLVRGTSQLQLSAISGRWLHVQAARTTMPIPIMPKDFFLN